MWGTLHIIPPSDHRNSPVFSGNKSKHRLLVMNDLPELSDLEVAIGAERGQLEIVETFDTILHGGEETPCCVLRRKDADCTNAWANLLWLQALVRKHGFAETQHPPHLTGPIAIIWGCEDFMKGLTLSLAELSQRAH